MRYAVCCVLCAIGLCGVRCVLLAALRFREYCCLLALDYRWRLAALCALEVAPRFLFFCLASKACWLLLPACYLRLVVAFFSFLFGPSLCSRLFLSWLGGEPWGLER